MKKGILKKILILLLLVLVFPKNIHALGFKVERSTDTVKQGNEVTVYIKTTDTSSLGGDSLNEYVVKLSYDSSKLEYKSYSSEFSEVKNDGSSIVITKGSKTVSNDDTLASIVFMVRNGAKSGSTNLTISNSNLKTINGKEITNATNTSSMITIAALSSDASLSNLKIPNTILSPKFDKNVSEYEANVKDLTEVTINATATDSNAKIMISDNYKNLHKGENVIKITVTAENGSTTKTYQIKVNLSVTPTEEELVKANAKLKELKIEDYELEFNSEIKNYNLTVPNKATKIKLSAVGENEKAKVTIDGSTTLRVGKNIIKINVVSEDGENKEVYTLTVNREKEEKKIVQTCPDETSTKEWIIYYSSLFATFTIGIILGYLLCKFEVFKKIFKKKNKKEISENATDESLSDTIELDTEKVNDKIIEENNRMD